MRDSAFQIEGKGVEVWERTGVGRGVGGDG